MGLLHLKAGVAADAAAAVVVVVVWVELPRILHFLCTVTSRVEIEGCWRRPPVGDELQVFEHEFSGKKKFQNIFRVCLKNRFLFHVCQCLKNKKF